MERIKLVKIKELEDAYYPNNIKEGYEKYGFLVEEPEVNRPFMCYSDKWLSGALRTSTVQEIIDKDTFRTYNSIYRIIRQVNEDGTVNFE